MESRSFFLNTARGDVPVLAKARRSSGPFGGTVLVYHGLGASKETQEPELNSLAERGFLAVGVDGVGHGERAYPDLTAYMAQGEEQFFLLVKEMLDELPALLDALQGLDDIGPIGLAGISMGGFVAFGAPLADARIRTVVPILGGADWNLQGLPPLSPLSSGSPHRHPQAFESSALFAWNAGRDINVPPEGAREFLQELGRRYGQERHQYTEYPESDHFMRPEDWADGWERTLAWFERFLR